MADTFKFELVSPERLLVSADVEQVLVPGSEGDFTMLPNHAPLLTSLRPGLLDIVFSGSDRRRYFVRGGFAEVGLAGLTVLAETAVSVQDLDRAQFAEQISSMEEDLKELEGDVLDRAIERLDHFKTIQQHVVSTAMH